MTVPSPDQVTRPGSGTGPRTVMVVPTYNEAENLEALLSRLHRAEPDVHVLVVDDASPDGTGALADALATADERVSVLHRGAKQGLGAAYLAGFARALEQEYDVIGEMDADGSHQPEQLALLRAALADADVAIGSRWVPGGSIVNWPRRREWLSRAGNAYTRAMLGLDIRDVTAGFRLYRRTALEELALEGVASLGYVFQADLAYRAVRAGLRVVEVPIEFVERVRGESKMTPTVAAESLRRITAWGVAERGRRWKQRVAPGR
ncbi:polyprenol monophosphomannose synthase [Nocardioides terrisoli]|uniref:polyprenol monophosphomannose synthase n=1 Tax=Nocardioides terrisoli TaxID=3388267 RepID=UPI00287B764C|nr:polyprenol monophosphomannose synthase [Nocardioides marmorisolisilvae]